MEDVLNTYRRQFGDDEVPVCMDETGRQQTRETRRARPALPGKPAIIDYDCERNGTASPFMAFAPVEGWRWVKVTDRRAAADWAEFMRDLADNLNTHCPPSFYEVFEPEEASRLCDRLEIHYAPKHGSWPDMAEIEIGVLSRQCLSRRIHDRETVIRETNAWEARRNAQAAKAKWRSATKDARVKLKSLYPKAE